MMPRDFSAPRSSDALGSFGSPCALSVTVKVSPAAEGGFICDGHGGVRSSR